MITHETQTRWFFSKFDFLLRYFYETASPKQIPIACLSMFFSYQLWLVVSKDFQWCTEAIDAPFLELFQKFRLTKLSDAS